MKKVLLTGASGFIGRQVIPLLMKQGYEVHAAALDAHEDTSNDVALRQAQGDKQLAQGDEVVWHMTNLLDSNERKSLIEAVQPSHILHFAWIATPGVYWTSPQNKEWHDATIDLLNLCKEHGAKRFVGAGSCAEYDWSNGYCDENKTPLNPETIYGKAKADCGRAVVDADGISTAWGRIFFLYGPQEYPQRFIPSLILPLLQGEEAHCGKPWLERDFLHVEDVASAFVALLSSNVSGAVNIASGNAVSFRKIAEMIEHEIGVENSISFGEQVESDTDPENLSASSERLRSEVGWQPSISPEEGVRKTIDWWRTHL